MKEMFKKAFGVTLGFYAACVAVGTLSGLAKRLKGEEDTPKKEESIFKEES